jgi:hypothetical protein
MSARFRRQPRYILAAVILTICLHYPPLFMLALIAVLAMILIRRIRRYPRPPPAL